MLPQKLPQCTYPTSEEPEKHGFQTLPDSLPLVKWAAAVAYRGLNGHFERVSNLNNEQIKTLAHTIAASFSKNEPMVRHLLAPKNAPKDLENAVFHDFFGEEKFGEWTVENLIYWIIRIFILSDPTSPSNAIAKNEQSFQQSIALFDINNEIVGGAFNMCLAYNDESELRENDPFLDAIIGYFDPILSFLTAQEHRAVEHLCEKYPGFKAAAEAGKVGNHFMIAKTPALPTEFAFEIFVQSLEHFKNAGYEYVITQASNQWTGAACFAVGGIPVHFAPFRSEQKVPISRTPIEHFTASPDGFLSNKDSGSMLFVIKCL